MTYTGTYFGMGVGKTLAVMLFMIFGLMLGINRKILPLSLVFLSIYLGSFFGKGDGRIYPIIVFFLISVYFSKKISNYYKNKKKHYLLKFFI